MKLISIVKSIFILPFSIACNMSAANHNDVAATNDSTKNGFAVLELFTSEGCSSCPPADAVLAKLSEEYKGNVYALGFHVDYWNRLGWKDVFSSADFSKRQHEYANYLHLQSVYTPQVIVNGKTEFVGSEEGPFRNALKASLQKQPNAQLTVSGLKTDKNMASFNYTTTGADKNTVLLIAVLQKSAQTKVERGENGGRTLSHVQIVRELQPVAIKGNSGTANVALPHGFNTHDWEIIGLLQNKSTGAVVGAARMAL